MLSPGASSFEFNLFYSSIFLRETEDRFATRLDGEVLRTELTYRRGLIGPLEFSVSIPLLYMNHGFLDRFIENYHKAFGFPDAGRSMRSIRT